MQNEGTRRLWATLLLLTVAGCGTARETFPPRTAQEQALISTAADRAIIQLPSQGWTGKRVFLDVSNLECYDKPYVVARLRQHILSGFGTLAADKAGADMVLEVASGALSIDSRRFLLGIPSFGIPVPPMGTLNTPELALYKIISYRGRAKLIFSLSDARTQRQVVEIPVCFGEVRDAYWWAILLGPFRCGNLPEEVM